MEKEIVAEKEIGEGDRTEKEGECVSVGFGRDGGRRAFRVRERARRRRRGTSLAPLARASLAAARFGRPSTTSRSPSSTTSSPFSYVLHGTVGIGSLIGAGGGTDASEASEQKVVEDIDRILREIRFDSDPDDDNQMPFGFNSTAAVLNYTSAEELAVYANYGHGLRDSSRSFFALNGFPCPTFRNPSDHYLRTINKDFDTESEGTSVEDTQASTAIDILTNSYKQSQACQDTVRRVAEICAMDGALVKNKRQASFVDQCIVLTKRSFVNMFRDLGYYWLRLAIYIMLGLCIGTIFYDVGHSYRSIQARGSMLMFIAGFLTFMAIGGFPSFVEDMKIFRRERLNGHYGVAAFAISNTLSSAPFLALISCIPGAIAYYLTGLQKGFDHFIFFCLVLYMCMLLVEGLMMIVASLVPNFLMGIITGAGIQAVMIISCGFFRLPDDLPKPVWKYPMYHLAFHKYASQGYYKNEFIGLVFPNSTGDGTITGDWVVRSYWQMEAGYSKWVDLTILLAMMVSYRVLFFLIVKAGERLKPMLAEFKNTRRKNIIQVVEQPLEEEEEEDIEPTP
ncbi:ABC transporter G family member 1-like [Curcuma longa]|uniref:ABC transporter G family member 1-like n=1 Tax=Curcuma longa TaxID=136217 RepID=UPI003D9EE0A2